MDIFSGSTESIDSTMTQMATKHALLHPLVTKDTKASGELQCTLKYFSTMAARLGRTRERTPKVTLLYCKQNTGYEFTSTPIWQRPSGSL